MSNRMELTEEELSAVTGGGAVCIDPNGCEDKRSTGKKIADAALELVADAYWAASWVGWAVLGLKGHGE